jgi:hypothetical protein
MAFFKKKTIADDRAALQADIAQLAEREQMLIDRLKKIRADVDAEQQKMRGLLTDGDLKDHAALTTAQRAVFLQASGAQLEGALGEIRARRADLENQLDEIAAQAERDQLAQRIDALIDELSTAAQSFDEGASTFIAVLGKAKSITEARQMADFLSMMRTQSGTAVAAVQRELRTFSDRLHSGQVDAPPRTTEPKPAPAPLVSVFTTRPIRWKDQNGAHTARPHTELQLTKPLADAALEKNAAVLAYSERAAVLRSTGLNVPPLPSEPVDLGDVVS